MTALRLNLVPAAYERRWQRIRRLRRWVTIGAFAVGVQIVTAVVLRHMGSQTRDLQRGLVEAERQQHVLAKRLDDLAGQEGDLDKQMQLADQLNRKHGWSQLLAGISACLPDTVVLTRCESDPVKSTAVAPVQARPAADQGQPEARITDVATGLVISGVATDHDSVATFLRHLNSGGRVGRCSLESTMRQPYRNREGVVFTIRTKW